MNTWFEETSSSKDSDDLSKVNTASNNNREWDSAEGTLFSNKILSFSTVKGSVHPVVFEINNDGIVSTGVPPLLGPGGMSDSLSDSSSSYNGHVYDLLTDDGSTNSLIESMIVVEWGRPGNLFHQVFDGASVSS